MKEHRDWFEYKPEDIESIAENYFIWEECGDALDVRVDFERACKYVGCWGKFLGLKTDECLPDYFADRMCDWLNGRLK